MKHNAKILASFLSKRLRSRRPSPNDEKHGKCEITLKQLSQLALACNANVSKGF